MDQSRARELLRRERERVEGDLAKYRAEMGRAQTEDPGELAAVDQHQADQGTDTYYREDAEGRIAQLEDELRALERAEARLAEGSYGRSVQSGEPIPDERLERLPTSERTASEESEWRASEGTPVTDPDDAETPLDQPVGHPPDLGSIPMTRGAPQPVIDPQEEGDQIDLGGMGGGAYEGESGAPDVGEEDRDDAAVDRLYRPER